MKVLSRRTAELSQQLCRKEPSGASKQAEPAEEGRWDSKLTEGPSRQGKEEKRTS